MWQMNLQRRLGVAVDGILGPISYGALFRRLGAPADLAHAFGQGAAAHLRAYGIDATAARLTEWLGEVGHESGGFRNLQENLSYSSAARICAVWPSRFPTLASAEPYVRNPEGLANRVYANRLGNGPPESGDGWRYRGRGLIQITGRDNYRRTGGRIGVPLEASPHLAADPETAVLIAADWWAAHGLNAYADRGESDRISGIINRGGPDKVAAGLADRRARKAAVRALWQ